MPTPLDFVKHLLGNATRQRSVNVPANLPDSPTLKRVLSARGSLRPIENNQADYDPNSVSPNYGTPEPEPWNATRVREVNPPTALQKAQQQVEWMQGGEDRGLGGTKLQKHGRMRSFLEGFLGASGQAANRALASGQRDWGGVAQALGGGLGGGAVYAADPKLELKHRHARELEEAQRQLDQTLANEMNVAKVADVRARSEARDAQVSLKERELALKQKAQEDKDSYYDKSLELKEKVLNNKISWVEYKKQQDILDHEFRNKKFGETVRHNKAAEGINQQNAESNRIRALNPPAGTGDAGAAYSRAEELQRQIDELNALDAKEPSYKPLIDSNTGEVVTDAKGNPKYSNQRTEAYEERLARKKVLLAEKERLYSEARKAEARTKTAAPKSDPLGLFK